jgi:hypothetical protein
MPLSAIEYYNTLHPDDKKGATGILEFILKDKDGNIIDHIIEKNIIKIFAKEMLAHRLPTTELWDPDANDWVTPYDDINEFAARYILLGASFDEEGSPLGVNDTRYYTYDSISESYVPIRLDPSAEYSGGLINAIPLNPESGRPIKKIENVDFSATYQPTGSPYVDDTVRAINNILIVETSVESDEYNGFNNDSFFTVTEVALAAGKKISTVTQCDLTPKDLFLEGKSQGSGSDYDISLSATANGTNIIELDGSESTSFFKVGDQIKIVNDGGTQDNYEILDQSNPYYLITDVSGVYITIDRAPVDSNDSPISSSIGVFRDSLKIFSHRILSSPISKSDSFEMLVRWNIIFN